MPLYVRAGAVLPFGPLKQFTGEKVDGPLSVKIYPGADGSFTVYEDDGSSFDFRKGNWMGIRMAWRDQTRTFSAQLASGSRMLAAPSRKLEIALATGGEPRTANFTGTPLEIRL